MTKGKVMITGASGYIGSAILLELVRTGYTANVVVRSEAKRALLATAPALLDTVANTTTNKGIDDVCTLFIVPDLAAPSSLDAATRGCDYVIHAASPIPFVECAPEEQHEVLIAPAVACTLSALESAKRAGGSVKRVVCTSSIGAFTRPALLSPDYAPSGDKEEVVNEQTFQPDVEPPFSDALTAYCASKAAALRRSIEWLEREKEQIGFDLVALGPAFVFGRHPLARAVKDLWGTSNWRILRLLASPGEKKDGVAQEKPPAEVCCGAHIDDVVQLAPTGAGPREREDGQRQRRGVLHGGGDMRWQDMTGAAKRLFPEAVEKGVLPNGGLVGTHTQVKFHSSKLEKAFGLKLRGVDEMVESIVPQYLELLEKEKEVGKSVDV